VVNLIHGQRNSGKSLYYERLLETYDHIFYFATLQERDHTREIIERHKNRRSQKWIVKESVGNINDDEITITDTIIKMKTPAHIMIDGIVNWCLFCSSENYKLSETADEIAELILKLTSAFHDSYQWYLLDNKRSEYYGNPVRELIWDSVYGKLIQEVTELKIIDWRLQL